MSADFLPERVISAEAHVTPGGDQSSGQVLTCPEEPTYPITAMILISLLDHVRVAQREIGWEAILTSV